MSYDGGDPTIPDAVAGPVERVIVIGAGLAGLTAANALTAAGVETVVVEARDRIGGRLHTVDVGGSPIDMGGSWIHTPIGNPLRDFASQAEVACRSANFLPEMSIFDRGEQRLLTDAEVEEVIGHMVEGFPAAQSGLAARLGPQASLADAIDVYVNETGLEPGSARRLYSALKFFNEGDTTGFLEQHSAGTNAEVVDYDGDYLGDMPVGGLGWVTAAMAADVDIRLNTPVTAVLVAPEGVSVTTADGTAYEGSHAIVTLPLGVLKHRDVEFSPPLEPERLASIDRLSFGRFEKIALRFQHPFWRDAGIAHVTVFPPDRQGPEVPIFGMDSFGCGPTLVAFVFPSAIERFDRSSPAEAAAWVLDLLSEVIGGPCPDPDVVALSSWGADPHTRGAYTAIPLGASSADIRTLAEPAHGRLLFAGEGTSVTRMGFADGAMSTGVREAKRLLQAETVELTT